MSDVLDFLVPNQPLTEKEWLWLVESRRAEIAHWLNTFTLPTLGRSILLRTGTTNAHSLASDDPIVEGPLSLSSQGLFEAQHPQDIETFLGTGFMRPGLDGLSAFPNGILRAWGLTRENAWVLIAVHFEGVKSPETSGGRERAVRVETRETDLATLVRETKTHPRAIWRAFEKFVLEWRERAESRFRALDELAGRQREQQRIIDAREKGRGK